MSNKIKVGDKLEVALTTTPHLEVGKRFEVVADNLNGREVYMLTDGYSMTILNQHPMLEGIGVILKLVEEDDVKLVPEYGDLMTIDVFSDYVAEGVFISDDGSAQYSDGVHVFEYANMYSLDRKYSHIVWYNK